MVCPPDARGFHRIRGFRDFLESNTQLLVCSCLSCVRRFRDVRRFHEMRLACKPCDPGRHLQECPKARAGKCPKKSGKKKAHKHKLFGPVALGTPRECPRDKPGLSPGQSGFVPGTNPGFSSYFTQRKPGLSLGQTRFVPGTFRGRRAADRVYVFKVYVPFSFPKKVF